GPQSLDSATPGAQHARMTEYVELPCVQCSRILRIRFEYIGHQVACKYCDHTFLATSRDPRVLQFLLNRNALDHRSTLPSENAGAPDAPGLSYQIEQQQREIAAVRTEFEQALQAVKAVECERDQSAADRLALEQWRREAESREAELRTELSLAQV